MPSPVSMARIGARGRGQRDENAGAKIEGSKMVRLFRPPVPLWVHIHTHKSPGFSKKFAVCLRFAICLYPHQTIPASPAPHPRNRRRQSGGPREFKRPLICLNLPGLAKLGNPSAPSGHRSPVVARVPSPTQIAIRFPTQLSFHSNSNFNSLPTRLSFCRQPSAHGRSDAQWT